MAPRAACLLLLALLALLTAAPSALGAPASLADLEDEVMCPTCNVPLNVAESPQADEQREFMRELIARGADEEAVKRALVAEYGEDVLALPDPAGFGAAAYVVPPLLVAALALLLVVLVPRWRRRPGAPPAPALSAVDAARLDEDLGRVRP
ncbi:MAG: cytochrome c-type biogenesis protein CcmH [Actinomycetota bacterium]|nr:cytochrome c-type biogenesis protein CcmH [Actinomycetota bacterium]